MAIFCLVLATAAFVLTAVPQACRCDRSDRTDGSDLVLRAMLSNDNVLEGNIWQSIRERIMNGDGNNNLISSAKLTHDIPTNPSEEVMLLEALINRYRKYVVERFVRFDDACSVALFGGGDTAENDDTDDNESRTEISHSRATPDGLLEGSPANGASGAAIQLQRDAPIEHVLCSRSAKQYYRCLMERFNDQQLIGMLQEHLVTYCFRRADPAALQKRDTPRYVSKQKFHSWGGKRSTAQVFYPWGGKRTVPRPHKQPKVVIRNPFHSWGGKRSGLAIDSSSV